MDTVRDRQAEPLRTAAELYGDDPNAVERLVGEMLREIPASLLTRAMILLANSIGPEARERLVARLNQTASTSEEAVLRRQLADENEAFAYVVAAAALFHALERGITHPDLADGSGAS
jgi:DNA polymerase III delta prime subunit